VIVVLDSGIWISALHFGGTPRVALEKAFTSDRLAVCDQIQEEVTQVLRRKMGWEIRRIAGSLGIYLQDAVRVPFQGALRGVCRDSKDDMVFECAVNAGAGLIVSGDKDLLTVGSYRGIRAVTARDYLLVWSKSRFCDGETSWTAHPEVGGTRRPVAGRRPRHRHGRQPWEPRG